MAEQQQQKEETQTDDEHSKQQIDMNESNIHDELNTTEEQVDHKNSDSDQHTESINPQDGEKKRGSSSPSFRNHSFEKAENNISKSIKEFNHSSEHPGFTFTRTKSIVSIEKPSSKTSIGSGPIIRDKSTTSKTNLENQINLTCGSFQADIKIAQASSIRSVKNEQNEDNIQKAKLESFDYRRTRYRYIKCWEDNRVQLVGIFQNMAENMSQQAIQMATSSSKSNYLIIKYFKDKVESLVQFSNFQISQIGTKGGDYFSKANAILIEIDNANQRGMRNSKEFAEFIEIAIVKDLLQANSLKYESRLNRYKDLAIQQNKRIQKVGRAAAESYQEYSNVFSTLAAKDLNTKNKTKLLKVFQRKDLCQFEWLFLSRVFEHYEYLKQFGTETVKFLKDLKELETERIDSLKQAIGLYIHQHEVLISKISYHPQRIERSDIPSSRPSSKNSSILSIAKPISLSNSLVSSKRASRRFESPIPIISHLYQCPSSSMNRSQHFQPTQQNNNIPLSPTQIPSQENQQIELTSPRKSRNSKEAIELQDLSHEDSLPSGRLILRKGLSSSPDERKNGNDMNRSQRCTSPLRKHEEIINSSSLMQDLENCSSDQEVEPYFSLRNLIPQEEQNYLKKVYELENESEVSFNQLSTFVEKFSLKDLKMPGLIHREFKAQYVKPQASKKDVLLILTLDQNILVVESLVSNFFKVPLCFIKGYRSKISITQGTTVLITEIKSVFFRTKNLYTFIFDYTSDSSDFLSAMKPRF